MNPLNPNENLNHQINLAAAILLLVDAYPDGLSLESGKELLTLARDLAETVTALARSLAAGGDLPYPWRSAARVPDPFPVPSASEIEETRHLLGQIVDGRQGVRLSEAKARVALAALEAFRAADALPTAPTDPLPAPPPESRTFEISLSEGALPKIRFPLVAVRGQTMRFDNIYAGDVEVELSDGKKVMLVRGGTLEAEAVPHPRRCVCPGCGAAWDALRRGEEPRWPTTWQIAEGSS